MKIALDHDGTITLNPAFWQDFVTRLFDQGDIVYVVTFRPPDCPVEFDLGCTVYYTNATPKRKFMEEQGIQIDIWIDDLPELIVQESHWTDIDREQWKQDYWNSLKDVV